MKNIFILSDSFHTYEFVNVIDYLFNFPVNDVILLQENHNPKEFASKEGRIKLYESIQQCVENSDITILLNNSTLPNKTIIKLKDLIKKNKKELISIDYHAPFSQVNSYNCNYDKNIPVILSLSIGNHSANFSLEVLLNKIFSNLHINFLQEYSFQTASILQQLYLSGCLNDALCTEKNGCEIIIRHLEYSNFQQMIDDSYEIASLFPDYIILNTNNRLNEFDDIRNYIFYLYGIPVFIVKSNFIEVYRAERSMKCVYCNTKQEGLHYIDDFKLEQVLEFDLLSHLSLPGEVYIV